MSSQTTTPKLTQDQSKLLDDLWFEEKHSAKGRRYYEKKTGDDTLAAQQVFVDANAESVVNFAGIWRYTLGSDRIFKNAVRSSGDGSSSSTGGVRKSSWGTKTNTVDWEKRQEEIRKGHEENKQMHEEYKQMHEELIITLKAVIDALEVLRDVMKQK